MTPRNRSGRLCAIFCFVLISGGLICAASVSAQTEGQSTTKIVDPLQLVPSNAIAFAKIDRPRMIVDRLMGHVKRLGLEQFDEVKELLQATPLLRFQRFLAYMETEYGRSPQELLDAVSGCGIVFALVPGFKPKEPQLLAIVQAKEALVLQKVYSQSLEVLKSEVTQAEQPAKVSTKHHLGYQITSVGNGLHITQKNEFLLIANSPLLLQSTITRLENPKRLSIVDNERYTAKDRPEIKHALAWGWVDLEPLKKYARKEDLDKLKVPTNDIIPHLLFGGLFDAYLRSKQAWFAVTDEGSGPALQISTPAGRDVGQEGSRLLHMHDPKEQGIFPLLNPPGTLYSTSFFWDLGSLWTHRQKLFTEGALKDFEEGDKKVKPFLAGNTLGQLMAFIGARHRIVVTQQRDRGYSTKAKTPYPSFAMVLECREPEKFAKAVALPIRSAGFFASTQVKMKLVEETLGDCKIVGYRFMEEEQNRKYDQGTLFNYSPCYARIGKFFIFCSTLELCRDLVKELQQQETSAVTVDHADIRHRFSWSALGEALAAERQLVATEITLRHGGAAERVEDQINALLRLLDQLGAVDATISHSPRFQLDLGFKYKP